jgi:hypothetical protein
VLNQSDIERSRNPIKYAVDRPKSGSAFGASSRNGSGFRQRTISDESSLAGALTLDSWVAA